MSGWSSSNPTITNCTFTGNQTNYVGSGVGSIVNSSPTLTNCILWGNVDPAGAQVYADASTIATISYSCIQDGWTGAGNDNIDADPRFVDADGADDTYGTSDDDPHLLEGSPCVNAGDDSAIPDGVTTDYEGEDRIQQCVVDMGADESPYMTNDCNNNDIDDLCEIVEGTSPDCNDNGIPDECDIAAGTSPDVAGDAIPDECEPVHNVTRGTLYLTIEQAIDFAVGGDEIEVEPGTYVERINLRGKAITLRSTDGPNVTTIDGNAADSVITCDSGEGPDTLIEGFTVTNGQATRGGGMYNSGSNPTVTNCIFVANRASGLDSGGGMFNDSSNPTLIGCAITGNSAYSNDYGGGGMYNDNSSPTITQCTFSGNSVQWYGGGMENRHNCSPMVTQCTFIGNLASECGGGMDNYIYASPTVANCTFIGNLASDSGGGMDSYDNCDPTVTNCTFYGNTASSGCGMYNDESCSATVTSCVLWGDTGQIHDVNSTTTVRYSCIDGGWTGAGDDNIDSDPMFVDPDGPDGDPYTFDDSNCRLSAGSPCIDTGDPAFVPDPGETDLDGHYRVLCGLVDMGSYEFGIGDHNCDQDVDLDDFDSWATCMTGPDGGPYESGCEPFDFEFDGDVDMYDFALFQQQFTGPLP